MGTTICLSERLDYQAVDPLLSEVRAAGDAPLVFDGANVRHIGALALQVLLSTVKTRASAGHETSLTHASDAFVDGLRLMGFTPETLTNMEAWT